jgi:predicted XRE-type DNA-binding protein
VFADLGLPDAGARLAKAEFARQIGLLIRAAGLTQARAAAARLGVDQPKVSVLLRGRLKDFSTDRPLRFVTALDHDVVITIRDPQDHAHPQCPGLGASVAQWPVNAL